MIAGGAYTVEFFNNSLVDFVSDGFSTDGNSGDTWIYVQAYKDYIVTASAESSTIATLIRQIPGPTSPITAQKIYIQSWREP
ncbi:MAG: hypothetical protein O2854_07140 [Chloroflexi bacterium]|nr:hypothetical protein [Chloroflexota bacterium]